MADCICTVHSGSVHVFCPDTILYPFYTVFPTSNSIVTIVGRALEVEVWHAPMNDRSYHSMRRDTVTIMRGGGLLRYVNHKVLAAKEEVLSAYSFCSYAQISISQWLFFPLVCVVSSFSPIRLTQKGIHLRPLLLETPNP